MPELVFFLSIFGYLVLMIFLKWATDWVAIAQQPPSLLNTLISMFMAPGVYTEESRLFAGQEHLQLGLVCMALLAVPPLLLGKPLLALREHRRKVRERAYSALAQAAEQSEQSPPEEARGAGPSEGGVGPARGAGGGGDGGGARVRVHGGDGAPGHPHDRVRARLASPTRRPTCGCGP